ncbi:putative zinc-binding metallopeptidase [Acinetobacter sp. ASP199]|uniref:zinc-binding metallopeptidase family protein n=1 Tax=unclassified Acinetobacter TaxID=196816 RepID=UPI001F615DCC|nr:putative zinc-binding metallopeptidase [Acinetobacter sp. ASP199]UNT60558.1 putative zinc-binding peptidase [Acinetobacter sp. ASP199]
MKYFACAQCKNQVFFEHSICEHCQITLGYAAVEKEVVSFEKKSDQLWTALNPNFQITSFKPCYNYLHYQSCNWVIPADSEQMYCESCQLTHIIPDLSIPQNIIYWARLEKAKRRFLYLAQRMNMMPRPKRHDQDVYGLRFNFLMPVDGQPVMTGHASGLITLNASEADVVHRETTRESMGENYRTLLGHFRHESGHYYFDVMQYLHPELLEEFRLYFGDERQDYSAALNRHYEQGPPHNWQDNFISSYATAHPWEDWAETWAHYLHMMETLETAYYATLRVEGNGSTLKPMAFKESPIGGQDFEHILENWITLTFNLNALNRSMGLEDAYPFKLPETVKDKLRFIHRHVLEKAFSSRETLSTNLSVQS